ncbi:MAG: hypothetical protein OEM02_01105 [Desulfobulbaceae bacterium]|nr:hypothetical protein [Desulfobulbaceae bacterium]
MKKVFILLYFIIILGWAPTDIYAVPANDNYVNSTILTETTGTITSSNLLATAEIGEPNHGDGDSSANSSIWFNWTAPFSGEIVFNTFGSDFDTVIAAYTGTTVDNLTKLAENDDHGMDLQSLITFTAITGTTYSIAVDGFYTDQGNVLLNWEIAAANDNYIDATTLTGTTGTINANNILATAETDEPNHGDGSPSAFSSIWFSWTAPFSGRIVFNTFGSSFDTVMAVYTGTSVDNLTKLKENDDFGADFQSLVVFTALAGTTYSIAIDGYGGEQGNVLIYWGIAPANDDFTAATILSGVTDNANASNLAASAEPGEPNHGDGDSTAYSSIWFSWTAPFSGNVVFNTFGSSFDTVIAAYTGTAIDNLNQLTENDDSGPGYQSLISFTVITGTTYSIAIDGFYGDQGDVLINFDLTKKFPWPTFLPAIMNRTRP